MLSIKMVARSVTIAVTLLILMASNISDELVLPNLEMDINAHQILKNVNLKNLNNDVQEYNIDINMDEEELKVNSNLDAISKSIEQTFESTTKNQASIDSSKMKLTRLKNGEHKINIDTNLDVDEENGENIKLNPISKLDEETFEINAKNQPSIGSSMREFHNMSLQDGVDRIKKILNEDNDLNKTENSKINIKTKAFDVNTMKRVKRDSEDDDIIIWDYCEGKTHLEFIDGKFECVEVTFESRSNIGSLVNCPDDTRRVILNRRVVLCRPKKRRH